MIRFNLEAPWYTFRKKLNALFEQDPDIIVGEVIEADDGGADFILDIEVRNHEKFVALDRVLSKTRSFGNVTLRICLYDEENANGADSAIDLYKAIFDGNPIVKDIRDATDHTGTRIGFVRFQPEVVQFFDDDISDYNGNWNGLAQDIAREVFDAGYCGVNFCTAAKNEDQALDQNGDVSCHGCVAERN